MTEVNSKLIHLGGCLDPNACFLLNRGMKTLSLRMKKQCSNAMQVAEFLNDHPKVIEVNYPGLSSSDSHDRAKKLLCGYGGMVSFVIEGGEKVADEFMGRLEIPMSTASLGGVESLVTRPVQTSHSLLSDEELLIAGIDKSLIRYSVGIESGDDLVADLKQALDKS